MKKAPTITKRDGFACVRVGRKMIYLGPWKSEAAREAYAALLGKLCAAGSDQPDDDVRPDITVEMG